MKRLLSTLGVTALLLGTVAVPSAARPGEIEVAGDGVLVEMIDAGESWITGDVWHVRGFTGRYLVVGSGANADYVTGENLSVVNWDWNLKNGTAHVYGKYDVALAAFDGGYSGTVWAHTAADPAAVAGPDFDPADPTTWPCSAWDKAKATGRGHGELEGMQTRFALQSDSCSALFSQEGKIFFPGQ
jgi:hypothetical protein